MKRIILALVFFCGIPTCLFAVDGQVLINQATVNAAGGFPYKITQPGSYKLSGNLTLATSLTPNYFGMDVGIVIAANNVTLDLGGFSITVNDTFGTQLGHPFYGIAESGSFTQVTIQNGMVRMTTNTNRIVLTAINMPSSIATTFQALNLVGKAPILDVAPPEPTLLITGPDSFVNHVVAPGAIRLTCPSMAVDNVANIEQSGSGCVVVNSMNSLVLPF